MMRGPWGFSNRPMPRGIASAVPAIAGIEPRQLLSRGFLVSTFLRHPESLLSRRKRLAAKLRRERWRYGPEVARQNWKAGYYGPRLSRPYTVMSRHGRAIVCAGRFFPSANEPMPSVRRHLADSMPHGIERNSRKRELSYAS